MKKYILMLIMSVLTLGVFAQNYTGSSKFTDNWSATLQGGVVTGMSNFFNSHPATTPIVVLGADKYITPAFGVGIDARTAIGTGCELHNPHTAFDAVNINGYAKVNIRNLFNYNGSRRTFEPVAYVGLGWGHNNCSAFPTLSSNYNAGINGVPTEFYGPALRNYVTSRAGVEFNFNLGKEKAWGIVVNPSVVWGNIDNARLVKQNGNFEVTAGVVYHFKTSNGTHGWVKHKCPKAKQRLPERIIEKVEVVKEYTKTISVNNFYRIGFEKNKAELTPEGLEILNQIPEKSTVKIYASASPEGSSKRNTELVKARAVAVGNYLSTRGIRTVISEVEEARQALIEIIK